MGFSVGLLDTDIYGPSMPIMFDVATKDLVGKYRPQKQDEAQKITESKCFMDSLPSQTAVIWRGPMASKALNQMIFDAHWGELDFLLLIYLPGTGDIHLSIMQSLPVTGAVVVSTPQKSR